MTGFGPQIGKSARAGAGSRGLRWWARASMVEARRRP
jgi:hypothetical protein